MWRKLSLALAALVFVVGCSKQKKDDASAQNDVGATNSDAVIEDKSIQFDPLGSDSGKIDGLHTIFFEYDTSTITGQSKELLSQNAEWLKNNTKATVQIEGHCDERGSIEYNLALGERRAKSVKGYLTGMGIDGNRLTIISYGEEKPLVNENNEAGWAKNRRANFVPLSQ